MRSLLVVGILVLAARAHADAAGGGSERPFMSPPKASEGPALAGMRDYFKGEIAGGFTLIGMGAAELATGAAFVLASDREGLRGASYPLFGLGLAHVVAGIFVNVSSAKRIRTFRAEITRDPEGWLHREKKRMKGVSTQFLVLEIVETVIAAGAITTAVITRESHPQLAGAGISLAAGMAATFLFDVVAARRADRYRRTLAGITF